MREFEMLALSYYARLNEERREVLAARCFSCLRLGVSVNQ